MTLMYADEWANVLLQTNANIIPALVSVQKHMEAVIKEDCVLKITLVNVKNSTLEKSVKIGHVLSIIFLIVQIMDLVIMQIIVLVLKDILEIHVKFQFVLVSYQQIRLFVQ